MNKILLCARREYKATALTKAFFFGAVVFPLVFVGAIIVTNETGILSADKPPIAGTIAIVDGTQGQRIAGAIEAALDSEERRSRRQAIDTAFEVAADQSPTTETQREQAKDQLLSLQGLDREMLLEFERYGPDADIDAIQARLLDPDADDALLAYAVVGGPSLATQYPPALVSAMSKVIPPELVRIALANQSNGEDEQAEEQTRVGPDELEPGRFRIVHQEDLDPDYVGIIRRELRGVIHDERYRVNGIDPQLVRGYESQYPVADTRMVSVEGEEEDSTAEAARFIPIAFFILLYMSTLTGGSYLFYGTLEEKGSRVMEVVLSAISPVQMMIGKIIGQGLVGLTVLAIYMALGLFAVDRFGMWSVVPIEAMLWMLPYFLMAYLFFGALYIAMGSAVTEIREAAALQAPLLFLIVVIFIILFPILDNPASPIARVMSYFPPTTPFVMVIRLSQPAHTVPLWEIIATGVVGTLGVAATIWLAAKIFRVGVLMYGKPPSFGTLLKWVMQS